MLFNAARTYIEYIEQPLHKWIAQHRRPNSSGQDTAVHLHLKEEYHYFQDNNVNILSREDGWFERGAEESVCVRLEWQYLNRGGGLWHYHPPTMQHWVPSPYSLITTHTWALATHTKAGWINDSEEERLLNSELTRVLNNSVRTIPHRV